MEYPKRSCIVEIKRKGNPRWLLAMFFWNGKTPVFARYGSDINDVIEWREKQ